MIEEGYGDWTVCVSTVEGSVRYEEIVGHTWQAEEGRGSSNVRTTGVST